MCVKRLNIKCRNYLISNLLIFNELYTINQNAIALSLIGYDLCQKITFSEDVSTIDTRETRGSRTLWTSLYRNKIAWLYIL